LKNKSKSELGVKSNPNFIHYIYVGKYFNFICNSPLHKIFVKKHSKEFI